VTVQTGTRVEVTPARGMRALREFVALPYRLHAGTPWVPPLKLERYAFLHRKLNAFFKHGEAEYFLARRDGRVVGRISAHVNRAFNEHRDERWGGFGFFEFEDDQEAVDGLLSTAEAWVRERGMERMVGPMSFTLNDEAGLLIDGYELEPMIDQGWAPPYYRQRYEQAGLSKAMDVYHWDVRISDRDERMKPILEQLAERSRAKHGIEIRKMSRRHLRRDMDEFEKVYNAAWAGNWDFVPYRKEDLDDLTMLLHLVFDRDWFMIAANETETVAAAISIPDINQVLKKMNGRLLPLGWFHYLNRKRIIDRCRIGFLGVLPEYQHTGVAAALYIEHFDMAAKTRIEHGEAGWILEVNTSMNRGLEAMGARIVKTCRIYERLLEAGAVPSAPDAAPSAPDAEP
jgi:GNAT superfamily N-acetyltransferase